MITAIHQADILESPHRHIAFAVNTEGYNDAGFAGLVARRFVKSLENTGEQRMADVLTSAADGKVSTRLFAIACTALVGTERRKS